MTVSAPRTAAFWHEDDSEGGKCRNAAQCAVCGLLQRPGESEAEWKARIRALWDATADALCRHGHLWAETMRTNTLGHRVCRACEQVSNRLRRARRLEQAS